MVYEKAQENTRWTGQDGVDQVKAEPWARRDTHQDRGRGLPVQPEKTGGQLVQPEKIGGLLIQPEKTGG